MITILLVIAVLAIIGHILEIDFSNIKKRFKSKKKSSPSGPSGEGYYGAIDRYCETVKKVFGKKEEKKENLPKSTEFFGEKEYLPIQNLRLPVNTPSFNVPILVNTPINILEMVGLDKYRWIVDNVFGLSIRGQNVDISKFCTIGATRTIVFFIGENNKFSLSISFDSGEAIVKTNSKEFALEVAILTFGTKSIYEPPKAYWGKASLESLRKAKKILEEMEK